MSLFIVILHRPSEDYISPGLVIGLLMFKINDKQHNGHIYFNVSLLSFCSLFFTFFKPMAGTKLKTKLTQHRSLVDIAINLKRLSLKGHRSCNFT